MEEGKGHLYIGPGNTTYSKSWEREIRVSHAPKPGCKITTTEFREVTDDPISARYFDSEKVK